jgi:hypothetical protein
MVEKSNYSAPHSWHLHEESEDKIEAWVEDNLIRLMDLSAALNRKVIAMFWGLYCGWELATGYPWGFFEGSRYDLLKESEERFVKKTGRLLGHASKLGIVLAHEIQPKKAQAQCAEGFIRLYEIRADSEVLGVFAVPSHCLDG